MSTSSWLRSRRSSWHHAGWPVPELLAEIYGDHLDWHQIARLVQGGCPPRLALRIVS